MLVSLSGIVLSILISIGIGIAGSQNGVVIQGVPVFLACGMGIFVIQWIFFIPAYIWQTEHYFDLTGSLTYIALAVAMLILNAAAEPRAMLIAPLVLIWALRLGSFLFGRIRADGHDGRFDSIKPDFFRFLMTWTMQGLWVFVTFSAGLAAMTSTNPLPLDRFAMAGAAMFLVGFAIEVVADSQKRAFRADSSNSGKFISEGVWAWSRHPNYFGEILLWCGIAVIALPVLSGWQYATLISPIFVFVLLTQISGVRLLEARGQKKWGNDPEYQAYCAQTPALMIKPW